MLKAGEGRDLPHEPPRGLSVQEPRSQHLHGNPTSGVSLLGLIHASHATFGDEPRERHAAEGPPDKQIGGRRQGNPFAELPETLDGERPTHRCVICLPRILARPVGLTA